MTVPFLRRLSVAAAALSAAALGAAAGAAAHAEIEPSTGLASGQRYALSVLNEVDGAATTEVVLTVPEGFAIRGFAESPGWERTVVRTGAGGGGAIRTVTWKAAGGGNGEDAIFEFTGSSPSPGTFRFAVRQTYSDGTVVEWADDEDGELPAAFVTTKTSLDEGGVSWLVLVALALGAAGLALGVLVLVRGRRRPA